MERTRTCVPPPQEKVHASQTPQLLTRQSTGHANALHASVADVIAHVTPPFAAGTVTARVRVRVPCSPHECVHGDQLPQSATTQSCGQGTSLHTRVAVVCSQALPPCCAATDTTNERD